MNTLDYLKLATEWRECGRIAEADALVEEHGPDVKYVRRRDRKMTTVWNFGRGISRENVITDVLRRAIVRETRTRDWFAWKPVSPYEGIDASATLESLSYMYKQSYPVDAIHLKSSRMALDTFRIAQRVTRSLVMSAKNRRYLARAVLA